MSSNNNPRIGPRFLKSIESPPCRRRDETNCFSAAEETGQSLEVGDDADEDKHERERHDLEREIARLQKLKMDFIGTGAYKESDGIVETLNRKLESERERLSDVRKAMK